MCEDVPPNRLTTISTGKERARAWIALDLVGQEHGDIKLWLWSVRH
jgi:hypothetical protein